MADMHNHLLFTFESFR